MPVRDRHQYLPLALHSYASQCYPRKELILVDDGDEEAWPLVKDIPDCIYIRLSEPMSLGMKRNIGCEAAQGSYIAQMDSDDWSHPLRISQQVEQITRYRKSITGYCCFHLWDVLTGVAHRYASRYVCGASLLYEKSWWKDHPFPDVTVAEDEGYGIHNTEARWPLNGYGKLVALLHESNTSTRQQVERYPEVFPQVPVSEISTAFLSALESSLPRKIVTA